MTAMMESVIFTIPIKVRAEFHIEPGATEIAYELNDSAIGDPSATLTLDPPKPLFGKRVTTYKVSSKGQIRVPSEVLSHIGIQLKEEVDIEVKGNKLLLIRGRFYQFRDLINELRPTFFSDQDPNSDLLTILVHLHPDEGKGRALRVDHETFSRLESLFHRIKAKFEPNNPKPWVGIPMEPEGTFEETGLSLTLNKSTNPASLTIQKLGPGPLPEPVSRLWREKNAFTIIDDKIYYYENGKPVSEKIDFSGREVSARLYRNGKAFSSYRTAEGYPVETIELYNGDLIVLENKGAFMLHYWPKMK